MILENYDYKYNINVILIENYEDFNSLCKIIPIISLRNIFSNIWRNSTRSLAKLMHE